MEVCVHACVRVCVCVCSTPSTEQSLVVCCSMCGACPWECTCVFLRQIRTLSQVRCRRLLLKRPPSEEWWNLLFLIAERFFFITQQCGLSLNSALGPVEKIMCSVIIFPVGRVSGLLIFRVLRGFVLPDPPAGRREFPSTCIFCWHSSGSSPLMCDLTCIFLFLLDISGVHRLLWGLYLVMAEQERLYIWTHYFLPAEKALALYYNPASGWESPEAGPYLCQVPPGPERSHEELSSHPRNCKPCPTDHILLTPSPALNHLLHHRTPGFYRAQLLIQA